MIPDLSCLKASDTSFTQMVLGQNHFTSLIFQGAGYKGKKNVQNNLKCNYPKPEIRFQLLNSLNGLGPDLVKDLELQTLRVVVYDKGLLRQINIGFQNKGEVGAKRGIIAGIDISMPSLLYIAVHCTNIQYMYNKYI